MKIKVALCFILVVQILLFTVACQVSSIEIPTECDSCAELAVWQERHALLHQRFVLLAEDYGHAISEITPTLDSETAGNIIYNTNQNVITAMRDGDFLELQKYIHPTRGVRISLFNRTFASTSDIILSRDDLLSNPTHIWGVFPGTGWDIEMSFNELFNTILWDRDYSQYVPIFNPVELSINHSQALGNAYIFYDKCIAVLHLYEGNDEWQQMDWSGLKLIYQEYLDGNWYLTGIMRSQRN